MSDKKDEWTTIISQNQTDDFDSYNENPELQAEMDEALLWDI